MNIGNISFSTNSPKLVSIIEKAIKSIPNSDTDSTGAKEGTHEIKITNIEISTKELIIMTDFIIRMKSMELAEYD